MSAWSRPRTGSSPSIEEITPRVKLEPVGLVKTVRPWARSTATSILVVVVLPLVPVTTTIPPWTSARAWARNPGSMRSATRPGSADPPPRSREATRAALPATTAAVVLSTPQTLVRAETPSTRHTIARMSSAPSPPAPSPFMPDETWLAGERRRLWDFARGSVHPNGGFAWFDDHGSPELDQPVHTWLTCRMTHVAALESLQGNTGADAARGPRRPGAAGGAARPRARRLVRRGRPDESRAAVLRQGVLRPRLRAARGVERHRGRPPRRPGPARRRARGLRHAVLERGRRAGHGELGPRVAHPGGLPRRQRQHAHASRPCSPCTR